VLDHGRSRRDISSGSSFDARGFIDALFGTRGWSMSDKLHPRACFACQCKSQSGDRSFLAGIAFALQSNIERMVQRLCPEHRTAILQGHFTSPVAPLEVETSKEFTPPGGTIARPEEGPTPSARVRLRSLPTLAPPSSRNGEKKT
jgi:hypothetical protein